MILRAPLGLAAGLMLLLCTAPAARGEPVPAPNSRFEVQMLRQQASGQPIIYGGQFVDSYQAEYSVFSDPFFPYRFAQIARFEVDLSTGTLRGFHSALTTSNTDSTTTSLSLYWGPTVRVVSTGGGSSSGPVPLELSVTLNGEFDTADVASLFSRASQRFDARLMPVLLGETPTWQTDLGYSYRYNGKSLPDTFRHERSADVNRDACPGCSAEVTGGDDSFAFGFEDLVLRTVLYVEPDDLINLNFSLSGRTTVNDFSAYGDWSRTARFGFQLPDGYTLVSESGVSLEGWNGQSAAVPEPSALALALAAFGALGFGARRPLAQRRREATAPAIQASTSAALRPTMRR